ncbi:DUF305 domain-containing protein [Allosaccharopolyspora coralli]|uniref:DUF305 domain-containing protein n=1 Tax=Allosaccharopolyspora coralli TaxID=2665642 RepID=UPI001E2C4223|nr:DUF305 domain-containing protein [Allosaccharopolyspora coralli]
MSVVTVLAAAVLAGCGVAEPEVVKPGAPGDEPTVVTGPEAGDIGANSAPGPAETTYVQMMIPHHEQALEMTALVPDRVRDPSVRGLADRIDGVQGPEIKMMQSWLNRHNRPDVPGHSGHSGHGVAPESSDAAAPVESHSMPGMATPEQMRQLAAADGAQFDRLFLELMIRHHEGAVRMATDFLSNGTDEQVVEMAQDVLVTQTDEIATMRGMLAEI